MRSLICLLSVIVILGVGTIVAYYVFLTADDVDYNLTDPDESTQKVFVTAAELEVLLNSDPGAVVLDARTSYNRLYERTRPGYGDSIPGSISAEWKDFTIGNDRGDLKPVAEIEELFREKGVFNDIPVVVYGSWKEEWGEEGRIWWQLEWLNHTQAYILYGGIFAWTDDSYDGSGFKGGRGDFEARPRDDLYLTTNKLNKLLMSGEEFVLVDARTEGEYNGDTPHGSPRGGHIPTAVSYEWKRVFDPDNSGNLKPLKKLEKEFKKLGAKKKTDRVVLYCTSGIRAGFLFSVFRHVGYTNVGTYASSWWVWSQNEDLLIEI